MGRDRAAYMREYRKNRRIERMAMELTADTPLTLIGDEHLASLMKRIAELEEEVRHLKAELAKRPMHAYSSRPFTPVPKRK